MIKVFTGPMYSEKSLNLIRVYESIKDKSTVQAFKPSLIHKVNTVIHSRSICNDINCKVIHDLGEIESNIDNKTKVIIIDEFQFLTGNVKTIVKMSIERGINFYIAGLSSTFEQGPFGLMPYILAVANEITMCNADCFDCKKHKAEYTIISIDKEIRNKYKNGFIPLCIDCLRRRKNNEQVNNGSINQ